MTNDVVLITGGSGFLGAHTIVKALEAGYRVRTTVRSLRREAEVRRMVTESRQDGTAVEIVEADLTRDDGWAAAAQGARYLLHMASPFPSTPPKDENELIGPARDGALRALRVAKDAGVERAVLTSSFAAIGYGNHPGSRAFTEADWTNPDAPGMRAYVKSKTLAERAARDYAHESGLDLTAINPVAIFGPTLSTNLSSSLEIVQGLLKGSIPAVPRLAFGVVDVRDVADLHLRAMTAPVASGQRYLAVSGDFMTMGQIAGTLRERLGSQAAKVPTRVVPDAVVRLGGLFNPQLRDFAGELGQLRNASNAKAVSELGWHPRSREDSLVDTARSLFARGLV